MNSVTAPKLRFKDEQRQNYPNWKKKKLEDFAICFDSKRIPVEKNSRKSGNIPYYGANGIQDYINDWIFDGEYVLLAEDGGHYNEFTTKPIAQYAKGKIWVNNHAHVIQANKDNSTCFLFHALEHKDIRKYINGSTRGKLTQGDMWGILFSLPSLPEQQKIADFLSSYDRMIDVQSQRLEAMKNRKKGLLQKIFSQEIRFKDDQGQNYPAWECIEFGEAVKRKSKTEFSKSDLPGVEYEDIISGVGRLNKNIYKKQCDKKGIVFSKGDVLYGKLRPYLKNWLLPDFKGVAIGDFWVLTSSLLTAPFLYYFLQSSAFTKIANTSIGTKMPRADWKLVQAMTVETPSLPEQQEIADFLTAVDTQIDVEEKRLETMKTIKKGLLQQMFI